LITGLVYAFFSGPFFFLKSGDFYRSTRVYCSFYESRFYLLVPWL